MDSKSYQNCYPFMYFLEHGKLYYHQAINAPMSIQPILLFYGLVHLIKACLLTIDPNYPNSTSVLAHGVSTRKLKNNSIYFSKMK
ncbi:YaaC family protein [Niallia circulans]